jgi:hypothetical protein
MRFNVIVSGAAVQFKTLQELRGQLGPVNIRNLEVGIASALEVTRQGDNA